VQLKCASACSHRARCCDHGARGPHRGDHDVDDALHCGHDAGGVFLVQALEKKLWAVLHMCTKYWVQPNPISDLKTLELLLQMAVSRIKQS